jgi:hypothetical protein
MEGSESGARVRPALPEKRTVHSESWTRAWSRRFAGVSIAVLDGLGSIRDCEGDDSGALVIVVSALN